MDMIQLNMPHYFLPVMSKNLIIYFVELNSPALAREGVSKPVVPECLPAAGRFLSGTPFI
jgi:hypothetical protein